MTWRVHSGFSSSFLHVQPASEDEELEELPVAHQLKAVTATRLVPLLEKDEGSDFLRGKATPGKSLQISRDRLRVCRHFTLFFRIDVYIHHHVLPTEEAV
jgi:hypothetical protein